MFKPDNQGGFQIEENIDELLDLPNVKIVGVKEPSPGNTGFYIHP